MVKTERALYAGKFSACHLVSHCTSSKQARLPKQIASQAMGSAVLANQECSNRYDDTDGHKCSHDPKENDAIFFGLTFGVVDTLCPAEAMNVARLRYEGILHARAFMTSSPTGKLIRHLKRGRVSRD